MKWGGEDVMRLYNPAMRIYMQQVTEIILRAVYPTWLRLICPFDGKFSFSLSFSPEIFIFLSAV
jgi:hypothetical protein